MRNSDHGMDSSKGSLAELLSFHPSQNHAFHFLIFAHRQADPDALCSAYAVSEAITKTIKSSSPDCDVLGKIIAPQGASLLGSAVSRKLGINFLESISLEEISEAPLIVGVDVGELELLEPFASAISTSAAEKFLVDHHGSNGDFGDWKGFKKIVNKAATSTCEIIALGFPERYLNRDISRVLLTGLMFDSQHLGIATQSTLSAALRLVAAGARIDETRELLRSKPERSEVIARIKSAQRLKYEEAGRFFIIQSEVSSFQASVARLLLDIGGDVGVAYGDHEGEARVSLRSTQHFFRETNIDLGQLLSIIATELGLVGGGHSTAASISGNANAADLAGSVIKRMKALILN